MKKKIVLMLVAISLMAGSAMAAIVADGSFEDQAVGEGLYWEYADASTPWYSNPGAAIVDGPAYHVAYPNLMPLAGSTGDQYMGMWASYMTQEISLVAGQEYTYSLMAAASGAGNTVSAYVADVGWMASQAINYTGTAGVSPDDWELHTWNFVATTSVPQLLYVYGSTGTVVDDVSVVPEPMTMVLLGLGSLLLRRKRR